MAIIIMTSMRHWLISTCYLCVVLCFLCTQVNTFVVAANLDSSSYPSPATSRRQHTIPQSTATSTESAALGKLWKKRSWRIGRQGSQRTVAVNMALFNANSGLNNHHCGDSEKQQIIETNQIVASSITTEPISNMGSVEDTCPRPSSLVSINVLMLLFYGTLGSIMPYLPIFYRRIGATDGQIGLLGAITPAVTFLVSPLWGALADTTGRHREILILTFIGSIVSRCLLLGGKNNVWLLSGIVAISAILNAPVKPLLDSAVLSMLSDKSAYGKSRLFGQIGFGLGSYIVGSFLQTKLSVIFLAQILLAIPTLILMSSFQPKKTTAPPDSNEKKNKVAEKKVEVWQALQHTLKEPKVFVFFLLVFIIGISSGIIENFAYVRLAEVGGQLSGNVLGTCRLASSLAGGPMFWLSSSIIQKVGVNGVLTMSMISYVLRFINYAMITSAWQALPAEILRGLTFATFWSGATYYVYGIAPKGLTATMLGLLNGVYGGIGQSLGSLIGGTLSRKLGISRAFYSCAAVDFAILVVFLIYQGVANWSEHKHSADLSKAAISVEDKMK